ncbi:hypothetical protein B0I37DRAFT_117043 [Chaetomium sp. MPI-CAGE-AT-0009]|nr:hypothetical protein B0I37DRAFT_117043 [Chaetomium sp. MPI-CAGE-AT-0009]
MGRFSSLLPGSKNVSHKTKQGSGRLRRLYDGTVRLLHVSSSPASQEPSSGPESPTNATSSRPGPENATEATGPSSSESDLDDGSDVSAPEPTLEKDPSVQLHPFGTRILRNFHEITSLEDIRWPNSQHQLMLEGQRFLLWARNLGLHRQGHASLDYRVRDATAVKEYLADVLTELQDNLDNILSVMKGERPPFEEGEAGQNEISDSSRDDDSDDDPQGSRKMSQSDRSQSSGSLHEVDFRQRNIAETIDSLYSLATRIRNPRNRPQRTVRELYKHIPAYRRSQYIKEREALETMVVSHIQSEGLAQSVARTVSQQTNHGQEDELLASEAELIDKYASPSHFLIRRTGAANARRKQQFTYWKEHAARIGYNPATVQPVKDEKGKQRDVSEEDNTPSGAPRPQYEVDVIGWAAPSSMQDRSLATSATRVEADAFMPEDLKSTISHQSRITSVSSVPTWQGQKLDWPPPPEHLTNEDPPSKYFTCPYCHVICPQQYLKNKNTWRSHLIHDLQPYHCTYQNCPDPSRLYGSQQEWIDHENQHARVWHCYQHDSEFETQRDYVESTSRPSTKPTNSGIVPLN